MQEAIQKAFLAGTGEWSTLRHPTLDDFANHVHRLGTTVSDLERYGADLYLALACGKNDEVAVRTLERVHRTALDAYLERSGFNVTERQDVLQQLLLHLCTGETPRILTYAGKASLAAWLKVATLRFAINMKPRTQAADSDVCKLALARIVADGANPEQLLVVEGAKPLFQTALARAMSNLSDRDTTILRLFFVDGIPNEGIGKLYGVHRATSARWIGDIRRRILEDVRHTLTDDFGVRASDFESLALLIRSELNLSLRRLFGAA